MYSSILVSTDGSKFSNKAVKEAAKLSKELGSKLVLFYAIHDYEVPFLEEGISAPTYVKARDKAQKQMEAMAQSVLASAAKKAKMPNGTLELHFVVSNFPYAAIIRAAKKFKCELIVMASHGRHGLSGIVLGSETHKVLVHSKIPVLVVR